MSVGECRLEISQSCWEWPENEWEWVKISGSGWECVGARFRVAQHEIKQSILSSGYSIFCVFAMFLFFPIFSAKF